MKGKAVKISIGVGYHITGIIMNNPLKDTGFHLRETKWTGTDDKVFAGEQEITFLPHTAINNPVRFLN